MEAYGRRALAVFALLGALLIGAAPASASSVGSLTVANGSPSNAAGARTQYVVSFVTSASGALAAGGTITVTFPVGTTFANYGGGGVFDGATRIGSCPTPNTSTRVTTCSIFGAIGASSTARLEFNGITNPGTPGSTYALTVATSSDTTPTSSQSYTVAPANTLSNISVNNTSPSNGAGARTQYVIGFATTATGGLSSTAQSTVDVTFPVGTTFANYGGGGVFDGATRIGSCPTPNTSTRVTTCSIFGAIGASSTARLEFNGITNPGTPGSTYALTVATSSDTTPTSSQSYTVAPANTLSNISVNNTSPSNGAGARTQYVIGFATTATGGLSSTAQSTVDVTFPVGTTFANYGGGGVFDGATRIGSCPTPNTSTRVTTCSIFGAIGASSTARLEFNGITNPGTPGSTYALTVATSSDTTPTSSQSYTVAPANTLSNISVNNTSPSNGAGARTQYVIGFATTATGGLSSTAQSTVDVTFPVGTTFANYGGGGVFDGATRIGSCPTPNTSTRVTTCSIFGAIGASSTARLEFNGITNPGTPGSTYALTVATSSDTTPTSSQSYTVAPANTLTNLAVAPGSSLQSATTQYIVTFTTSPTGALSNTAQSTVDATFPAGTTFANYGGGGVFDGATRIGSCPTPNTSTRVTTCSIFGAIGASTTARLEFNGITNPGTPGSYRMTVATSSDTSVAMSSQYGIAVDTVPPETTLVSGPPGTTTNPQPTFTFSSSEPGSSFECSLDGASFAPCTSPFVAPPLAAGVHTFQVRAKDPSGNPDATAATQTFTIAATSAAPPPAPTAGKTVVVSEVAGTVRVRVKGSKAFVELNAAEGIPVGSTVDTTHGTVLLTSQSKSGGASQSAKFFDGIFLVTQQGPITKLKLTQKLAKCTAGKASVATKRPKKRRLWGDGKGKFRTEGKHSAATVVGTKWLVQDSCAGTLTKVARGVVSVRDNVKHKTIRVKAGKRYLAKPPR